MPDITSVEQVEVKGPVTDGTEASGSDPFVYPEFVEFSKEAVVSVSVRRVDVTKLSDCPGDEVKRNALSPSAEEDV